MYFYAPLLLCLLGAVGYVRADCYPGDSAYTKIVQEIYRRVTTDYIYLTTNGERGRSSLCKSLAEQHNSGKNSGQEQTNNEFLGSVSVSADQCVEALTNTRGYDSIAGWRQWAGYHSGKWYGAKEIFLDSAAWADPYQTGTYAVQPVRFDSEERVKECVTVDQTGATCRNGWNQSGQGVPYVWGWDPKKDGCDPQGKEGAHVGFTFNVDSTAACIVWVTPEEAFLECVGNGCRSSTSSRRGQPPGYGQWTVL